MKNLIVSVFVAFITVQISAQNNSFTKIGNNNFNRFYVDLVS
jgi:hypothetical protein